MRNNRYRTNVINLKKRRLSRKYKALYCLLTKIKMFLNNRFNKQSVGKNYKKTINH